MSHIYYCSSENRENFLWLRLDTPYAGLSFALCRFVVFFVSVLVFHILFFIPLFRKKKVNKQSTTFGRLICDTP